MNKKTTQFIKRLKSLYKGRKAAKRKGFTLMELLVAIGIFSIFIGAVSSSYIAIVRGHDDTNQRRKMIADVRYVLDIISEELKQGSIDYWYSYCDGINFQETQRKSINPLVPSTDDVSNEFKRSEKKCISSKLGDGKTDTLTILSKDQTKKTTFKFDRPNKKVLIKKETLDEFQLDITKFQIKEEELFEAENAYINENQNFQGFQELELANTQVDNLVFIITPLDDPYATRNYSYDGLQFQPQVSIYLTAGIKNQDPSQPAELPVHIQTSISSRLYAPQT